MVAGSPASRYRFDLNNGQLVGTFNRVDDQSWAGYTDGRLKVFDVTSTPDPPGQITCWRARGWLQR